MSWFGQSDEALYRGLVSKHAQELRQYALRLCRGRAEDADDLVQDTYQEAWRSIAQLRDASKARGWLFQILRHRCARVVRDEIRRQRLEVVASDLAPTEVAPDDFVNRNAICHAVDQLDERFRVPLLMLLVEGLTCQEIADELDIPLGTALSRIHRARSTVRELLSERQPAQGERRLRSVGGRA
jgi:RNA polymerase sigma-70 factor (ECF subfamily)